MTDTINAYLQTAFNEVCTKAKKPKGAYVSLVEYVPYYGGPEEGGWWGEDRIVVAYQWYDTQEAAKAAAKQVRKLAQQKTEEAAKAYGEQCLRECEWCEDRGLDADYLPETDGPSTFDVRVSSKPPANRYGTREWS